MRTGTTILEFTADLHSGRRMRGPGSATPDQLWSWRQRARCRGSDSSVFFAPDGERGLERRLREGAAKAICARCPVRQPCATYALSSREQYGVWGGLSERERVAILRRGAPVPEEAGSGPTLWSA